jgi:outer membrane protein OmpA-like peptidoglycan-associated protein
MRWSMMVAWTLAAAGTAGVADVPGSKDPAFLKRYAGSEIVFSVTRSFDTYELVVPDPKDASKTASESLEGTITRLFYRVPAGHTSLELFRNYEQAVKAAGLSIAYEALPCQVDGGRARADQAFGSAKTLTTNVGLIGGGFLNNPFVQQGGSATFAPADGAFCFFTAKGTLTSGQPVGVTVAVGEKTNTSSLTLTDAKVPTFKPGEIAVMVDVVMPKPLETNMVDVTAVDIAETLASKGVVDLYGIYFDVDKSEIKPQSRKTLDQIAVVLKIDRSLRLEVSGHTDSTGDKAHNLQLSTARAQAVVRALTVTYGIAAARLEAKGYGDSKPVAPNASDAGRAKNRRVELRKL